MLSARSEIIRQLAGNHKSWVVFTDIVLTVAKLEKIGSWQ